MNVLGISGTPREMGNSHILLEHSIMPFKDAKWDVTILRLRQLTVKPCIACDFCRTHEGLCKIEDDMNIFLDAFRKCDAIIVASPVYSRNVCAQLMAVFDRHYAVNIERPLEGKVGGAIAVGAGEGGGQAITIGAIYNWMRSCGVIGVPGELNGVTAKAMAESEILKQEKRLRQARVLGENVLRVTTRLRGEQTHPHGGADASR